MAAIKRAVYATGSAQYIIFGLAFVRLIIVSRVLTSAEIGAYVLASALVLLAAVPRVLGIPDFIVATRDATHQVLATCFTVMFVMGLVMSGVYFMAAQDIAAFFKTPALEELMPIMVVSFIVLSFGLVGQAMMRREMRFGQLAMARVSGAIAETIVALGLVFSGFGVMALAWGFLAANTTTTAIVVLRTPQYALFWPRVTRLTEVLRFGLLSSAGTFLMQIGDMGPPLVLGRAMDTASVGFYARGQTLINFFRQGIESAMGPVMQPWFASQARREPALLSERYCQITRLVSALTWPFYAFVFVKAPVLIPLLLGPGWEPSIDVARALAVGGLFSPYALYGSSLLTGSGNVGLRLFFAATTQTVRFSLLGAAVVLGAGLTGFAWTLALSHLCACTLMLGILHHKIRLSIRTVLAEVRLPVLLGAMTLLVNLAVTHVLGSGILAVIIGAMASVIFWVIILRMTQHPIMLEIQRVFAGRITGP